MTMSHHYSGPDFGFPLGDARLDLTDLYAFPKPGDATKSVLIMNVHPSSTVIQPHPTTLEPFAPEALYEFNIDTDGDAVADIVFRVQFSRSGGRGQTATLTRLDGLHATVTAEDSQIVIADAPVSMDRDALIAELGEYRFFAGWRSEPFFFDTLGALNDLRFTGSDFFSDKNVCSVVLEVSNAALGSRTIGLWARVLSKVNGSWIQVERGARPQQAVFLPGSDKEAYLAGEPVNDERFVAIFAHALEHTGGYSPEEAARVAQTLLPDILYYDPTLPALFPDNGRTLTDDASDAFIAILTNGKLKGDGVGHHHDLLREFPYVGPPHGS
jgi:hypothetical protein